MCLTWSTALASAARQRTREVACCSAASAPSKPCPSRATLPLRDASTIACVPPESAFAARSPSPPSPPVITSAPRSCTGFSRPTASCWRSRGTHHARLRTTHSPSRACFEGATTTDVSIGRSCCNASCSVPPLTSTFTMGCAARSSRSTRPKPHAPPWAAPPKTAARPPRSPNGTHAPCVTTTSAGGEAIGRNSWARSSRVHTPATAGSEQPLPSRTSASASELSADSAEQSSNCPICKILVSPSCSFPIASAPTLASGGKRRQRRPSKWPLVTGSGTAVQSTW